MSLSYESHSSTGTPLLKADENLIETLEDNQVTKKQRFISFFHLMLMKFNKFNVLKSKKKKMHCNKLLSNKSHPFMYISL